MGGNPLLSGADQLDTVAREWPTQSRLGKQAGYSQGLPCVRRGVRIPPYPTVWGDALASRWGALYMRVLLLSIGNLIIICVLTTVKLAGTIRSYEQR